MKMIYKSGGRENIWGFECETKLVRPEDAINYFRDGWFERPGDWESKKSALDINGDGEITNDEVRELAKESGIEGWETKRISTLKKALEI